MKQPIQWFEELTAIPRASGEEGRVCDYLEGFARERGLAFRRDEWNNAVIKKPASGGAKGGALMLQAHLDIVPVKDEGVEHDFSRDPVRVIKEGDVWRADGTTLGADNGLGVAMIMALLDDDSAVRPDLECVFTAEEETGMFGAAGLEVSDLKARRMINLDCGGEGHFTTSCAGGVRVRIAKKVARAAARGDGWRLEVTGLSGGHSGGQIHTGRANAVKLMARALAALAADCGARVCALDGGGRDNVIPSYMCATFLCAGDPSAKVAELEREFKTQYASVEPELKLVLAKSDTQAQPLADADRRALLDMLLALPYGPRAIVPGQSDLVETSANTAMVSTEDGVVRVNLSIRSSNEVAKRALADEVRAICDLAGAEMETEGDYPGWPYAPESPLREAIAAVYKAQSGKDAVFFGIHAGLECGLFMGKMPGLDAVAMGAESGGAHTTKEWMSVSSLERTYSFLRALVADLAQ